MTWSVVAVDRAAREAGVAVASCVPLDVVDAVPAVVSGRGALVTQSYLLAGERERAADLLRAGLAPHDVLGELLDPAFDPAFALRQIAIVDLDGRVASFTGEDALAFAAGASREVGDLVVAVQGNVLTGPEVVDAALAAAFDADACDLPARLLAALEAGGVEGRGDARCVPLGRSAQSATLRAGAFSIDAGVDEAGAGDDPLAVLRARFDAERVAHPCPTGAEGGTGGARGTGGASTGETTDPPHVADGSTDGDGCGIATHSASPWLAPLVLAGWLLSRRRPHRRCRWGERRSRR